jgi:YfiH family protein
LLHAFGRAEGIWVSLRQVHGAEVVQVTANAGRSIEADALWTRDRRAVLAVLLADCVPILLADVKGRAVAAVHAGWRGTCAKVAVALVGRLVAAGIAADDLRAAIGPAIGPCCFDVDDDVAAQLREAFPDSLQSIRKTEDGRAVADLWALNRDALVSAGLAPESIETLPRCTSCNGDAFFSHRRDQGLTGRQAGLIALDSAPIS